MRSDNEPAIDEGEPSLDVRSRDPERWLAQLWAPVAARPAWLAITAYDLEQARIVAEGRDPILAEIRLAWWREQLVALAGGAAPPPQPILRALADHARPRGVDLAALAMIEEGHLPHLWEGPRDAVAIARARGGPLFVAMARAMGKDADDAATLAAARDAGTWWAAARLVRDHALLLPMDELPPFPVLLAVPPLAGIAKLARSDLAHSAAGRPLPREASPGRQARLAWAVWRASRCVEQR